VSVEVADLARRLATGDRRALARSITLVESTRADVRLEAAALLDAALPATGGAVRVGISGTPGAGKSTFIDELGTHLTGAGHRVAVLAVDPSSRRSGGSIMGDKTRMERLSRDPAAFIRPSPSGGTLGGVARRTREAAFLCEAAGFDVVLIETVGVGQSETVVADMVDCFVLIAAPGGGDDLQGIKRGIMELADIIVINKADGDLLPAARRAASDHRQAAHLLRPKHPGWAVPVLLASALHGTGIDEVWQEVERFAAHGGLVLGICNGFQVLCEAGLLPGALLPNTSLRFVCRQVEVEVVNAGVPWTRGLEAGQRLSIPAKHTTGRYWAPGDLGDQAVLRYAPGHNFNGSAHDIAGVCNEAGNVLGLMPHPEHAVDLLTGSVDGLALIGAPTG
jgi:LAO/AO transport system kinase